MKRFLQILDVLLLIMSPIAILFFLLGSIMLPVELNEHPNYLEALDKETIIVEARVDYIYDDGDIHLEFTNPEGKQDYRILDTIYYTPETQASLQIDSIHIIRYVPKNYDVEPALENHLDQVRAYRQDLSGLYFILGISWLALIIRPDFLYVGYISNYEALFNREIKIQAKEEEV